MNRILFICGSLNQTTMMHRISTHLKDFSCFFTPYYATGLIGLMARTSILNFSILAGQFRKNTLDYLQTHGLQTDLYGRSNDYDLVITCSDLIIPSNIKKKKIILVQEGMTDPENLVYKIVKYLKLPRWLASTSTTGLSDAYDKFCVASEGYKEFFIKKGVNPEKIEVTGIPNFDDCKRFIENDFPYKNFVLVATSDSRETFKYENRKKFLKKAVKIANRRKLIFKLHPNEIHSRAEAEINKYAPGAIVLRSGNTEHMIANCDVLITRFSSVVYVGLVLGKEVHSDFDLEDLKRLIPLQNDGTSAYNISLIARELLIKDKVIAVNKRTTGNRAVYKLTPEKVRKSL
jgi:hypothetical protein